ncbi:MAG: hypothetical protein ACRDRG_21345 [Pseudonocardiaceae bacterium]
MHTLTVLTTAQNQVPPTQGLTSLLLLFIVIVVLIFIGSVLIKAIGTLTSALLDSIQGDLKALIVVVLAIVLMAGLAYAGWERGRVSTPAAPSSTVASMTSVIADLRPAVLGTGVGR